ncbi:hypothetical protein TD95_003758 [Thielaviopsis punctulata]|uniref:Peptidase A1 domain-containing protein n=1 Tax=Thielaviopsis punctulata TaxID=72032 RepID=A0A0F4Z6S0_9PEZI|nr:hypothetical protein TD95_003758 [Thielaviopsis punctulata]
MGLGPLSTLALPNGFHHCPFNTTYHRYINSTLYSHDNSTIQNHANSTLQKDTNSTLHNLLDLHIPASIDGISFRRLTPACNASADTRAAHSQRLTALGTRHNDRSAAHLISSLHARSTRRRRAVSATGAGVPTQNITVADAIGTQYSVQVEWDGEPVALLFDTGSSDTWAVRSDFTCRTAMDVAVPQDECLWGPGLVKNFGHGEESGVHFQTRYGSGERVSGPMGWSDLGVAGMTVRRQQVGLANETFWYGNNVTNGILGMAYAALTSGYEGYDSASSPGQRQTYRPFFSSMVSQGLVSPVFAVALSKEEEGGVIGWGGLPTLDWTAVSIASTDILIASVSNFPDASSEYTFYTIVVDGIQYGQVEDTHKYLYIIDTGTTLMYLPPVLAEAIAKSFEPTAVYLYQYGAYFAPCNASPPRMAVIINNIKLWINPADLLYQDFRDAETGYCAIGVTTGDNGPYILGDVFLQSVMAVFDVGAAQMRFYGRYE